MRAVPRWGAPAGGGAGKAGGVMLFVSGATTTIRKYIHSPHLGRLIQPRNGNDVADLATCGLPAGADNDALQGVDPDLLLAMWDRLAAHNGDWLKFVTPRPVAAQYPTMQVPSAMQ